MQNVQDRQRINRPYGRHPDPSQPAQPEFPGKVFTAVGIAMLMVGVLLLLGYGFHVVLLLLAGTLVAVFFRGLANWLHRKTDLAVGGSLLVSVAGVLLIGAGLVWLLAPRVSDQVQQLSEQMPKLIGQLRSKAESLPWVSQVLDKISSGSVPEEAQKWLRKGFGVLTGTLGVLADLYVILFVGIFLTAQPDLYRRGLIALVPLRKRTRAGQVLDQLGTTLFRWLAGKLFSMAIVGVLTTAGLYALSVPLAFALGLFAGLVSFVPNFGPVIALVPAALLALSQGPTQVLWVVGLYIGVQAVESNLLTPLIQKKMVEIPPALIIIGQVLLGVFTGGLGLILATPLLAIGMVLVKMLYVEDVLGDESVQTG